MSQIKKVILSILLCFILISLSFPIPKASALSTDSLAFILLSSYQETADIGDHIYLFAVASTGKSVTWKSSDSKIASVNTYGVVTAKKAGSAMITAKIKNAEASCLVMVNKTQIILNKTNVSLEHGEKVKLSATTSNGSEVTWKSSKKSVASIDDYGTVTAVKPGETTITAKADGTSVTCQIIVKSPTVKLSKSTVNLYRTQTTRLSATVSSGITPTWRTSKKSVAVVDETGTITAIKNGTATITATVDGVSKTCEVTVLKPDITLNQTEITLKKGESVTLTATVSSGNAPTWSSSNSEKVSVNSKGKITALQKGSAYIYAKEDGTKVSCKIKVTE